MDGDFAVGPSDSVTSSGSEGEGGIRKYFNALRYRACSEISSSKVGQILSFISWNEL